MESGKKIGNNISSLFSKNKSDNSSQNEDVFETIKKLSELKEQGIITQEEFDTKKAELLSQI